MNSFPKLIYYFSYISTAFFLVTLTGLFNDAYSTGSDTFGSPLNSAILLISGAFLLWLFFVTIPANVGILVRLFRNKVSVNIFEKTFFTIHLLILMIYTFLNYFNTHFKLSLNDLQCVSISYLYFLLISSDFYISALNYGVSGYKGLLSERSPYNSNPRYFLAFSASSGCSFSSSDCSPLR